MAANRRRRTPHTIFSDWAGSWWAQDCQPTLGWSTFPSGAGTVALTSTIIGFNQPLSQIVNDKVIMYYDYVSAPKGGTATWRGHSVADTAFTSSVASLYMVVRPELPDAGTFSGSRAIPQIIQGDDNTPIMMSYNYVEEVGVTSFRLQNREATAVADGGTSPASNTWTVLVLDMGATTNSLYRDGVLQVTLTAAMSNPRTFAIYVQQFTGDHKWRVAHIGLRLATSTTTTRQTYRTWAQQEYAGLVP
jgi:hypothetical protein